jgi:hypothetical protein
MLPPSGNWLDRADERSVKRQELIGVEPRADVRQTDHRAHHETRACHEHQRHRELHGHQGAPGSLPSAAGQTATAGTQHGKQVGRRGTHRGHRARQ